VADHSNKIWKNDRIDRLFGESMHKFLYYKDEVKDNWGDKLLRAGILVLTVERMTDVPDESIVASLWPEKLDFGSLLMNSPKSHHDFVLVGSDGEEAKVHKFALASQCFFPKKNCSFLYED
jgi:hypothetical protein